MTNVFYNKLFEIKAHITFFKLSVNFTLIVQVKFWYDEVYVFLFRPSYLMVYKYKVHDKNKNFIFSSITL